MRNKYNNKKTVIDGIKFDSKREASRYCELLILQKAGEIKDLKLQPKYTLQMKFRYKEKTYRAITYIADFQYIEIKTGLTVVEDVKGMRTKEFNMKEKLFLFQYGKQYDFRIVK